MENKSGFKECSRCGLRNKPTAKQCDFCGQKFEAVDEWEMQLDALEKLNRETKRVEVTEDVSKRIQSTILRREIEKKAEPVIEEAPSVEAETEAPHEEKMPEPVAEPPKPELLAVHEEQTTVITFTATEAKPIELEEEKQVIEEPPVVVIEEAAVEETLAPTIEVQEPFAEPEPQKVKEHKIFKKETFKQSARVDNGIFKWKFDVHDRKSVVFMIVLLVGIGIYIASMAMSSALGTMGAWSAVALSGVMIVVGVAQIAIDWNPPDNSREVIEHHETVIICPNCNEKVGIDDEICPACGTEFEPSEL